MTNNETRQISPNCTSYSRIELAMVFQHLNLANQDPIFNDAVLPLAASKKSLIRCI